LDVIKNYKVNWAKKDNIVELNDNNVVKSYEKLKYANILAKSGDKEIGNLPNRLELDLSKETRWRSKDLFKAWEPNINGMIRIQKSIAYALVIKISEYIEF